MNCEKCQELLSDWLDNELPAAERITVGAHLAECRPCLAVHDELNEIFSLCVEQRGDYAPVPQAEALWRRINNVIEAETSIHTRPNVAATPAPRLGLWQQWRNHTWQLSLPQLASAVAAVALVVSLASVTLSNRLSLVGPNATSAQINLAGQRGENLVQQRQNALDYWLKRVEQRKAQWKPQMRQAFDYNLSVLNQAVNESRQELVVNPQDEISEERLNAALEDKLELLKEFAEL